MDKVKRFITLDRTKLLDSAIFFLLEADNKAQENFGPLVEARIDEAIDTLKDLKCAIDELKVYPTSDVLDKENLISKKSEGISIGDEVIFTVSAGYTSRVVHGEIKEPVKDFPKGFYKITYLTESGRRSTVTRGSEDFELVRNLKWNIV